MDKQNIQEDAVHSRSKFKQTKHTAKVSPEIIEMRKMSTIQPGDGLQQNDRGSDLLFAIKNKKKAEASKLLDDGASVKYVDQAGCNVLHYAAVAGYDDLLIKLISCGADVKIKDCNGETPLHKASRAGHDMALVILISYGVGIQILNLNGQNAFELAVKGKHVKCVETLCMFGADLVMQEWIWLEDALNSKNKKLAAIFNILKQHYDKLPGFKHGGILHSVKCITGEDQCEMKQVGIRLTCDESKSQSVFLMYCSKLKAEYTDVKRIFTKDQNLFGDVFQCRTWWSARKVHTLHFELKGLPQCNETIEIVSPNGKIGRVESINRKADKNITEITATINIKNNIITTFMFVTVSKPEVFAINKERVHIQPQMEPNAEIDIPADTFDKPGDLIFNVVETKGVNVTDTDAALVTNVAHLSMSNKQQPNKPIVIKMPMHSKSDEEDIVILSSSKDFPEVLSDWDVISAKKDPGGKFAKFEIRHFSIYAGVSKKKVEKDMEGVTELLQSALNNERPVEFFVSVLSLPGNQFLVVFECALQRKAKKRKKVWENKNYQILDETIMHALQINQWFKVEFEGNLQKEDKEQIEVDKMMFQPNQESFKVFNIQIKDLKYPPKGCIRVSLMNEQQQKPNRVVESKSCMKANDVMIPGGQIIEYVDLFTLPLELKPSSVGLGAELADKDFDCTINVLKMPHLAHQLRNRLRMDEAHELAVQLKVTDVNDLIKENPQYNDFLKALIQKWRGKRPYGGQADILARALQSIGKCAESEEIKLAYKEKRQANLV